MQMLACITDTSDEPQPSTSTGKTAKTTPTYTWRRHATSENPNTTFQGQPFDPPLKEETTPLWYFCKFMDKSIFEDTATQTSIYAHYKEREILYTNVGEIEIFTGMHVLMSVVKMPSYRLYWAKATRYEPVASVMS